MICEGTISHWVSKVILRTCSDECKLIYRKFEKLKIRITNERFHLQFNLACINNILFTSSAVDNFSHYNHKKQIMLRQLNREGCPNLEY